MENATAARYPHNINDIRVPLYLVSRLAYGVPLCTVTGTAQTRIGTNLAGCSVVVYTVLHRSSALASYIGSAAAKASPGVTSSDADQTYFPYLSARMRILNGWGQRGKYVW